MTRFALGCVFSALLAPGFVCAEEGSGRLQGAAQPLVSAREVSPKLREVAKSLIETLTQDKRMYPRLVTLCDRFGPRLSGSANLERAIDWVLAEMVRDGLNNAHGEPVMVPRWVRQKEQLSLLQPSQETLPVLGFGGTVPTPAEGVTGNILVVNRVEELLPGSATGRIVLFAAPFVSYEQNVPLRIFGANAAAQAGAKAALLRSLTPQSLGTPHTGVTAYKPGIPQIPFAAITTEDADRLARLARAGVPIEAKLFLQNQDLPPSPSRNIVAEVRGRVHPEEVVVFGCHLDSWDVGQGAHDDGGNCVAAWHALVALQKHRPAKTVRLVMWVNEENGLAGAKAYAKQHAHEKHVLGVEADAGVFRPTGWSFSGSEVAKAKVQQAASLLGSMSAAAVESPGGGTDLRPLAEKGVPVVGLSVAGDRYFVYHHSAADTVDKVNPADLGQVAAALAVFVYGASELF